jgi:hypothetical protein
MHAMLPARSVMHFALAEYCELIHSFSGMGGNTAMRDTATMLPLVMQLSEYAEEYKSLPTSVVAEKLSQYEAEMIPRAFGWVEKSGGTTIMVCDVF